MLAGGATSYAAGKGLKKIWKRNPIGKGLAFMSGMYGANSGTLEQSFTFVELMKEQLAADGKEFTPENIQGLLSNDEVIEFKDPRLSSLDITGTRAEIMRARSIRRGLAIGFVDGITGLVSGSMIGAGRSFRSLSTAGIGIPIAGGITSEVAGQTAGSQEYDAGEILTEGFAEKAGPLVAFNTTREAIDRIKNPSVYKINGQKINRKQFIKETSKMSNQDINGVKIEVTNDKGISNSINERRLRAKIDNQIDPNVTNVKDREKLIDLEMQRSILENNQKNKKGVFKLIGG